MSKSLDPLADESFGRHKCLASMFWCFLRGQSVCMCSCGGGDLLSKITRWIRLNPSGYQFQEATDRYTSYLIPSTSNHALARWSSLLGGGGGPKATILNVQFRWGFWASSWEFSGLRFPYMYNVDITNQFQTTFAERWGGKSVSKVDAELQGGNLILLSHLRSRIRPLVSEVVGGGGGNKVHLIYLFSSGANAVATTYEYYLHFYITI
jgi:hypothetical protein